MEIDVKPRKICLINVYLPTRGSSDCDITFQAALDEVHEIMEKFVSSHKILTGDFNTSLHRQENCRRDRMLKSFLEEHGLSLSDNCPVQPTYMHKSTSVSSQIDYWFVRPVERESVSIGSQCPENLSDHVEVVLRIHSYPASDVDSSSAEPKTCQSQSYNNKSKIRWDKCDLHLYSDILQTGIQRIEIKHSTTLSDIDLTAVALKKILYDTSAASPPKKRKSGVQKKKNRLPVWNEMIEAAV